jgi:hypothetical protein
MSLISHRLFMPKLLMSENREVSDSTFLQHRLIRFAGLDRLLQIIIVALQIPLPLPQIDPTSGFIQRPLPWLSPTSPRPPS